LTKTLLQRKKPSIKQGLPVKKKWRLTVAFISVLLLSAVAGTQFVNVGKANPLPDINPNITIENPQNATYHVNTITLNFTIESNWGVYPCFYSLDGQKMEPIENLTVISREDVNIGKNPQVHRTTLKGSCVLSNLSEGWHNVTFYLITDHEISLYRTYVKGDVLYSATVQFVIDSSESLLTALVVDASGASVAILGIGLLVYFKKRKKGSGNKA
jgi:hypothetical protein